MPANRDIRDRYTEIIGHLVREHGSAVSGYEISKDATLAQCIGYARRFVVGGARDEPHYRYDRYMRVLQSACRWQPIHAGTVVHVDIGCGPGLFTWVVRDYFRANLPVHVELYGYDHAICMVELATSIWDLLEENANYSCHHDLCELISDVKPVVADACRVLITLGHVLVQTVDDNSAVDDFARIIAMCARIANCLLVAVDAQTGDRPEDFRRAHDQLQAALEQRGLTCSIPVMGRSDMVMSVRVTDRP